MCCERAERIEAGKQRHREPPPARIEPQGRRPGQDADAVPRPDRRPVLYAFRVVPHAVAVDDVAAGGLGDAEHAPVDVVRHAADHALGRIAQPLRPALAHEIVVAADAAGRDDDGLRLECKIADHGARAGMSALDRAGLQDLAVHAVDDPGRGGEATDAMAEAQRGEPLLLALAHAGDERGNDAGPGAPGDVEARHRVAVLGGRVAAALGPADDREPAQAPGVQPGALLGRGEGDIGLGPLAGPEVLLAVEAGRAQPVLQGKVVAIADAHAPLLGRVDEEQAAERPERLAAQRLLRLLIEQDHLAPGLDQLGRGDQPGKPAADDDGIRVHLPLPAPAGLNACLPPAPAPSRASLRRRFPRP